MGYVNDYDLAQDLAQETFIIVWQKLETFRNESSIGTWIFRIASNNCLRQIEKKIGFKAELP
jgi:RNA polymerase sigma-70 factor (ECF subfamily)